MKKQQYSFKSASHDIETIDNFIKSAGVTRSKFVELMVKSAAESIRSIETVTEKEEWDEELKAMVPYQERGKADMRNAREIIESIFRIKQVTGDDDE